MDTKNWQWIKLGDLFSDIYKGNAYNANELIFCSKQDYALLYVTRTDLNNGTKGYVLNDSFCEIEEGNALVIGDTTSTIFYQEEQFICGDHIVVMRADWLNRYTGLFITTLLSKERFRYNYGRAWNMNLIKNTRILLPCDDTKNPDWQYIELLTKDIINKSLPTLSKAVWKNEFSKQPLASQSISLKERNWNWFCVDKQLFDIDTGKDLIYSDLQSGDYPVIGHKATNNGVTAYTKFLDDYYLYDNNTTIALADRGNFFASVQTSPFYIGTRVKALRAKFDANIFRLLFICVLINRESYKYNYGRNCCDRISSLKIKFPVDSNGNPDWQFMEDYIKSLPYSANL